jgi:hypothetical protein
LGGRGRGACARAAWRSPASGEKKKRRRKKRRRKKRRRKKRRRKKKAWQMAVRVERITALALHEAYDRRVEETIDTL